VTTRGVIARPARLFIGGDEVSPPHPRGGPPRARPQGGSAAGPPRPQRPPRASPSATSAQALERRAPASAALGTPARGARTGPGLRRRAGARAYRSRARAVRTLYVRRGLEARFADESSRARGRRHVPGRRGTRSTRMAGAESRHQGVVALIREYNMAPFEDSWRPKTRSRSAAPRAGVPSAAEAGARRSSA